MFGSFSKLVENLAAEMRGSPRPPAVRQQMPTVPSLMKALGAEVADRKKMLATLASIKTGPTAADRDTARERIRTTLRHADEAFAAGKITGQELAEIDIRARHLMSSIP
jgi:hypothetical protein